MSRCARVHAAKESDHAIGVFLLKIFVDVEKRVRHQLHPQLFDLMDDLELHFVGVAEFVVVELAGEKRLCVEVDFVVERAVAAHDCVKLFSIHVCLLGRTEISTQAPCIHCDAATVTGLLV